jgi:signal transduction histidine kinase/CheY-like chemotaxis protein
MHINKRNTPTYQKKAEFLSVASHEVRGPVGNIITYMNLHDIELEVLKGKLNDTSLNELFSKGSKKEKDAFISDLNDSIDKIHHASRTAKQEARRTLNSLINLGNLYQLKTEGVKTTFSLSQPLREWFHQLIASIPQSNTYLVPINLTIDAQVPEKAIIDNRNLKDSLRIILGNAIRFTTEGNEVKMRVRKIQRKKISFLSISVEDYGPGMSKEQQDNLLKTFLDKHERTNQSRYRKPSLQLPVVEMKMKAMGGSLSIESELGQGSILTLMAPYQVYEGISDSSEYLQDISMPSYEMVQLQMLLVEDDLATLSSEKRSLELLGQQIDTAMTGAEAVAMAQCKQYDAIWMDISLPDFTGIEAMHRIKNQVSKDIYFVAVTSHASEEDVDNFISEGMTAVLLKPASLADFKACIEGIVADKLEPED